MKILDANMILRYIIDDNPDMANEVQDIIQNYPVLLLPEVIAEVVFVMHSFYKKQRIEIVEGLFIFMDECDMHTNNGNVLADGLRLYGETSLDFVDCLLAAYHAQEGHEICTFDKKLKKLIKRQDENKNQK